MQEEEDDTDSLHSEAVSDIFDPRYLDHPLNVFVDTVDPTVPVVDEEGIYRVWLDPDWGQWQIEGAAGQECLVLRRMRADFPGLLIPPLPANASFDAELRAKAALDAARKDKIASRKASTTSKRSTTSTTRTSSKNASSTSISTGGDNSNRTSTSRGKTTTTTTATRASPGRAVSPAAAPLSKQEILSGMGELETQVQGAVDWAEKHMTKRTAMYLSRPDVDHHGHLGLDAAGPPRTPRHMQGLGESAHREFSKPHYAGPDGAGPGKSIPHAGASHKSDRPVTPQRTMDPEGRDGARSRSRTNANISPTRMDGRGGGRGGNTNTVSSSSPGPGRSRSGRHVPQDFEAEPSGYELPSASGESRTKK